MLLRGLRGTSEVGRIKWFGLGAGESKRACYREMWAVCQAVCLSVCLPWICIWVAVFVLPLELTNQQHPTQYPSWLQGSRVKLAEPGQVQGLAGASSRPSHSPDSLALENRVTLHAWSETTKVLPHFCI